VSSANARLTLHGRRTLVQRVLAGHKPSEVAKQLAKQLNVSRQTVYEWIRRFRDEGDAGLHDRSSVPDSSPRRTSPELTARIVAARVAEHVGARELSVLIRVPASTIGWCCAAPASRTWPTSAGSPASCCVAVPPAGRASCGMSTTGRARCCTSTSRSSARSPARRWLAGARAQRAGQGPWAGLGLLPFRGRRPQPPGLRRGRGRREGREVRAVPEARVCLVPRARRRRAAVLTDNAKAYRQP